MGICKGFSPLLWTQFEGTHRFSCSLTVLHLLEVMPRINIPHLPSPCNYNYLWEGCVLKTIWCMIVAWSRRHITHLFWALFSCVRWFAQMCSLLWISCCLDRALPWCPSLWAVGQGFLHFIASKKINPLFQTLGI